eukprot:9491913-Pyramimonas_sp.AAC.1
MNLQGLFRPIYDPGRSRETHAGSGHAVGDDGELTRGVGEGMASWRRWRVKRRLMRRVGLCSHPSTPVDPPGGDPA